MKKPSEVIRGFTFALYAVLFLVASATAFSEEIGPVKIGAKEYFLPLPDGFCEASKSPWGVDYIQFLNNLSASAGGDPVILNVFRDCGSLKSKEHGHLPTLWGYLAFDRSVGKAWLGQGALNRRLRKTLSNESADDAGTQLKNLTDRSLEKIKANIRIGEIKVICDPVGTKRGFMTCGLTRLVTASGHQDVYLVSVIFLRNREILTLTLYRNATDLSDLDGLVSAGKKYLAAL